MKILSFSVGLCLILFSATCQNSVPQGFVELSGTIEERGITSYQYGTHILENEKSFYAIKSEHIDLSNYLGETITVKAEKIEGYPVDGGPEYYEVLEVE